MFHSSRRYMTEINVLAGLCSLWRLKGKILPCFLLAFVDCMQSLTFFGFRHNPPFSPSVITWCPPCVSVFGSREGFLFSYRDTSHIGFRAHPNPVRPHLNLGTCAKTLFPNKVTFTGSGWTSILGDTIQPSRASNKKINRKKTLWNIKKVFRIKKNSKDCSRKQ